MTTLAILADIHGNLPALEAVLNDLAQFQIDHVIIAGDVVNVGPFSAQVMERVIREGWAVIRGNNEFYLLDYSTSRASAEWNDRSAFPLIPWLQAQLSRHCCNVIAAWPDALSLRFPDAPPVRVVHGSPRSPKESIYSTSEDGEIAAMLAGVEETTLIAGHTHLALDRRVNGWRIMNPGSVGVPLDGVLGASYMLLDGNEEGWRPTFRRVPFDHEPLWREFERLRFVEECGIVGQCLVKEFETARLQWGPFLRWRKACCPLEPLSLELLSRFSQVNIWDWTPLAYHVNR